MQSRMSVPLIVCILGTAAFNCLPVVLGRGLAMYGAFALYTGLVLLLSQIDRRVLAYALVLTVCNPSGGLAPLSYSFLLAGLIVLKESRQVPRAFSRFMAYRWWLLLVVAAGAALLSIPMWSHDPRGFLTDAKQYLSHLVYIILFGLAIAVTLDNARDARRVLSLACLFTITTVCLFYFFGEKGVPQEYTLNVGLFSSHQYLQIGMAYMAFTRTQMCILIAVTSAVALAISISILPRLSGMILLGISGLCVFLIMQLASTGSAFAMVVGMAVSGMGMIISRPSPMRIIGSVTMVALLGTALVYAVFQTDNLLAKRIDLKQRAIGIDRMELWEGAMRTTAERPLGSGWTTEYSSGHHTHNDFLVYFLSFGWLAGGFYFGGCLLLGVWLVRRVIRFNDSDDAHALALAGLAGITVYGVNSMLDMLSAGIGNYQTVWALILIPAVTITVRNQLSETVGYVPA